MYAKLTILLLLGLFLKIINSQSTHDYSYETKWFEVPLDHFSYKTNKTFKIKYLENNEHWYENGGPIFFYTGNEGQIEQFAKHTGFMWEIAHEFNAKIVFAEHRYYGASMPFGNKSLERDNIGWLTSEQALADYADLVMHFQNHKLPAQYPVIAFGGSYGGMLAAYFRLKYPHLVTGAIAASAPIHMFPNMVPCGLFNRIITSSFNLASATCVDNIKRSWPLIRNITSNPNNTLHKDWKLCDPVKNATDVSTLMGFLTNMYTTLAMVNYPYPCDFLVPLPGQPVRYVCQYLNETLNGERLLKAIEKVLQVYANYDGKRKCVDYRQGDDYGNLDASGWDYQACTEMVMPICSSDDVIFETSNWNFTEYSQDCYKKYGVYPRENFAATTYGGDQLRYASNIVFSNGLLDPWTAGGILSSLSDSVNAVVILNGAHHLDLMASNPADPDSVKMAREEHKRHITNWLKNFHQS